jgi:hypothetical protein
MLKPSAIWGQDFRRRVDVGIALEIAERAIEGRESKHERAMFAMFEVAKRLKQLKADYHAAWHGEKKASECT